MAIIIWLLGALDVWFTKYGLAVGAITEGNPIMAALFSVHPDVAVAFSLIISAIFLACLHKMQRMTRLASQALRALLIVRIVILLLHINWMLHFIAIP